MVPPFGVCCEAEARRVGEEIGRMKVGKYLTIQTSSPNVAKKNLTWLHKCLTLWVRVDIFYYNNDIVHGIKICSAIVIGGFGTGPTFFTPRFSHHPKGVISVDYPFSAILFNEVKTWKHNILFKNNVQFTCQYTVQNCTFFKMWILRNSPTYPELNYAISYWSMLWRWREMGKRKYLAIEV